MTTSERTMNNSMVNVKGKMVITINIDVNAPTTEENIEMARVINSTSPEELKNRKELFNNLVDPIRDIVEEPGVTLDANFEYIKAEVTEDEEGTEEPSLAAQEEKQL